MACQCLEFKQNNFVFDEQFPLQALHSSTQSITSMRAAISGAWSWEGQQFDHLSFHSQRGIQMIQILFRTASVCCLFSKIDAVLAMCSLADAFGTVAAQVTRNMCDAV